MNVLLLGLRGAGKSTVGPLVAERLKRAFCDLDLATPEELGCSHVAEAWARHGEPAFRAAETRALARVLQKDDQIIALGGGTPIAPGAAELIERERGSGRAWLCYLHATPGELRARLATSENAHRPSLTGAGVIDEVAEIYSRRDGLYRALANAVVETDGRDRESLVGELVNLIIGT